MNTDLGQVGQKSFDAHIGSFKDELLTTAEAATVVHLNSAYLANLRYRGGGPEFIRIGRKVYYELRHLCRWLESRTDYFKCDI